LLGRTGFYKEFFEKFYIFSSLCKALGPYRFDTYETKWGYKHGIDEMELIEKIMSDDEAFEIICRILPIKAQSQTAAYQLLPNSI